MSAPGDFNRLSTIAEEVTQLQSGPPPTGTKSGAVAAGVGAADESGNKRKLSRCWDVFKKPVLDDKNKWVAVCKYCNKSYAANVNGNGTSSLNAHVDRCKIVPREFKNCSKKILNFKPIDVSCTGDVSLTNWIFNQEISRNKLARMLVIDELPFRHIDGEGFKDFVNSLCPMFKIPSRYTSARDVYSLYLNEMHVLKTVLKNSCPRNTYTVLHDAINSDDWGFREMATKMKLKYDKYWGDPAKLNLLIFVSAVFDPRHKFKYVKYVVNIMYPESKASDLIAMVDKALLELFCYYSTLFCATSYVPQPAVDGGGKPSRNVMVASFKQHITTSQGNPKNELDRYLNEELESDDDNGINLLVWWKQNSVRYPIVSRMAKDVLPIPISTVSSESAFSTGGRVLTDYRSSLTPRMVESLICTQDWIRKTNDPINLDEHLKDIDATEEDLLALCLEKEKEWEAVVLVPGVQT